MQHPLTPLKQMRLISREKSSTKATMMKESDCTNHLQATADALVSAGADRLCILDALMTTAIKIASEDPRDSEWVHLIDAAQFLLEKVEIHRGTQLAAVEWEK